MRKNSDGFTRRKKKKFTRKTTILREQVQVYGITFTNL